MRKVTLAAFGALAMLSMASPAQAVASPNIDDVIEALSESPVYIAPGTEGTSSDTAAVLEGQMREGDTLVIVMFPSSDEISSEEHQQITQEISDGLGETVVVGVSVGDSYDAAGPTLPAGIADELMRNADTVSQSPVDTMGTFIRNVRDWERLHPSQVSQPDEELAAPDSGTNGIALTGGGILVAVVVSVAIVMWRRRTQTHIHEEVRFNAPRGINGAIRSLMALREEIDNPALRRREGRNLSRGQKSSLDDMSEALLDVCKYTEAYFSRLHPDKRLSGSVRETYEEHLETIELVVKRYIDMTLHPEYFDDPEPKRIEGVKSVQGFAEFVLNSIRQNNRTALTEYTVGTKILTAQRFR